MDNDPRVMGSVPARRNIPLSYSVDGSEFIGSAFSLSDTLRLKQLLVDFHSQNVVKPCATGFNKKKKKKGRWQFIN